VVVLAYIAGFMVQLYEIFPALVAAPLLAVVLGVHLLAMSYQRANSNLPTRRDEEDIGSAERAKESEGEVEGEGGIEVEGEATDGQDDRHSHGHVVDPMKVKGAVALDTETRTGVCSVAIAEAVVVLGSLECLVSSYYDLNKLNPSFLFLFFLPLL